MQNFKKTSWYASLTFALITLVGAGCTSPTATNVNTDTSANTGTNSQTATTTETNGTSAGSETTTPNVESSQTETVTPSSTNTDTTPTTVNASVYADGTYSATGTYSSPAGKETVPVTLTLVNDVITDVSVSITSANPTSKQFQVVFANNFKALVLGKNIADVNLSKVSGASLTPKGFNDAIAQIKTEAKV